MSKKRWNVTMINRADRTETQRTFTWAETAAEAMDRINAEMNQHPEVWGGWTYTIQEA
ncbi:hypothetical protein AB0G42_21605 [Streptomyces yangpuensis]|uniref:hypothetical protein n=1 Tax=Streptomyces yangpuensis TaxID=1648182 RepID=UPI00342BDE59